MSGKIIGKPKTANKTMFCVLAEMPDSNENNAEKPKDANSIVNEKIPK